MSLSDEMVTISYTECIFCNVFILTISRQKIYNIICKKCKKTEPIMRSFIGQCAYILSKNKY